MIRSFEMNRRDLLKLGLLASAGAVAAPDAFAQAGFPNRPIKLVVPFAAGGVNDIMGRQWAERMKPVLGTVYVENLGGAGGTLGVMEVKRADPDGHTIALGSTSTMVLNTLTMNNVGYDPNKDFVPIAIFCVSITSIAVHPSVPAKNVQELIAYVKANAGKVSYGSAGAGTMSHLSGELFKLKTGMTDMVHVPYKGAGPGLADLVSGHIPIMSPNISGQVLNFHSSGKIRIIAINSKDRLRAAPDIPTAIEQGVPDMVGQLFLGIFAPAATPKAAVDAISAATKKAVDNPEFEKVLIDSGFEPAPYFTAESAKQHMAEEFARWKPVVERLDLKSAR
jgi:tripartite-type tricarboxylate transporter receptor subunit TctC